MATASKPRGGSACPAALLVLALGVAACGPAERSFDWEFVDQMVAERFPNVSHISTTELASALSEPNHQVLLLDARTPEEYAISHLEDARLVEGLDEAAEIALAAPVDTLVVVYCSVGLRSAAMADQLQAEGVPDVVNLEGSIFAWANEGRAVYRGDAAVSEVHPYNDSWGALLDKRLWTARSHLTPSLP